MMPAIKQTMIFGGYAQRLQYHADKPQLLATALILG